MGSFFETHAWCLYSTQIKAPPLDIVPINRYPHISLSLIFGTGSRDVLIVFHLWGVCHLFEYGG